MGICCYMIAVLQHWKVNYPDLYAAYQEHHREVNEEPIEIFHSTVRQYAESERTANRLAEMINFHGATRQDICAWLAAAEVSSAPGGLCVDRAPAEVNNFGVLLKSLFEKVLSSRQRCGFDTKAGTWCSPVLGALPDKFFPFPLQLSPTPLNFPHISVRKWKAKPVSTIRGATTFSCGHERTTGAICLECRDLLAQTVHTVVDQMKFVHKMRRGEQSE